MTENRQSTWSRLSRGVGPGACILTVAVVLVVAALESRSEKPGTQAKQEESRRDTPYQQLIADGNRAFQQKKWDVAITAYEKIVREFPDEATAWFRLGYCLHVSRQYDRALEAYRQSLQMPRMKPVAYYNMSCAYALKGNKSETFAYLRKSIDAGFRSSRPIAKDPDFAAYLDDPEFQKLAGLVAPPTGEEANRQFDFWIGKWDVHNAQGEKVGVNEITKSENGYLLTEKWRNTQRESSGTSINYYDPRTRNWKQVWVDADGGIICYSGAFNDGTMRFTGDFYHRKGTRGISRATYTPLKDGRVHQLIRRSTDGGKTWTVYFDGYYTRKYSTL